MQMMANALVFSTTVHSIYSFFIYFNFNNLTVYFFISAYILSMLIFIITITYILGNFSYNNYRLVRHLKFFKTLFSLNLLNLTSLIGIPPLVGFTAKFILLNNVNFNKNIPLTISFFCLFILSLSVYFQLIKHFKSSIKLTENDLIITPSIQKYKIILWIAVCITLIIINTIFFKDFLLLFLLNV